MNHFLKNNPPAFGWNLMQGEEDVCAVQSRELQNEDAATGKIN